MSKVLITSGGTIVKIDDVRHIGNFSTGTFPSQLAEEILKKGDIVYYLHAKNAVLPFSSKFIFNPYQKTIPQFKNFRKFKKTYLKFSNNLILIPYQTVDEYATKLREILSKNEIDMVFLGAAVSDYTTKFVKGKITSNSEILNLTLTKNPKYIQFVKKWSKKHPFQVGFKLLSNVSSEKLIETAYKSGLESKSDITIANDLSKIKAGKREVFLVTSEKGSIYYQEPNLAKKVIDFVYKRKKVTYFKTQVKADSKFIKKYSEEKKQIAKYCRELVRLKMMTPFYKGSNFYHGSIAIRTNANEFIITSRKSNKKRLSFNDLVLVRKVDWIKRIIYTDSLNGVKPSFNAVLMMKIFEKYPNCKVVLHTHILAKNVPTTDFTQTPGTLEYADSGVSLIKKNRLINLKDHGLLVVGDNLEEIVNYVKKNI
jgi:hypothetical protein